MDDKPTIANRLLLPIGWDELFFLQRQGKDSSTLEFWFDWGAIEYVLQEAVMQGATSLLVPPTFNFKGVHAASAHVQRRTKRGDTNRRVERRVKALFRPVVHDLGFNPASVEILENTFAGPSQQALLQIKNAKDQKLFAQLILAINYSYHLALGIEYQSQVDLPFCSFLRALDALRVAVRDPTAATNLAFVTAIVQTYCPHAVGAVEFLHSTASEQQVRSYLEFVEDEEYRQYAEAKHELGFSQRVSHAFTRLWQLSKRLASRRELRPIIAYTSKIVAVSTGAPEPPDDAAAALIAPGYMPPIVRTSGLLFRAQDRWLLNRPPRTELFAFQFILPSLPLLTSRLSNRRSKATIVADVSWLIGLYIFTGEPIDFEIKKRLLTHLFAINLETPYECPLHLIETGVEDVSMDWKAEKVTCTIMTCCEEAAKQTFAKMCAFDATKDYSIIGEDQPREV